MSPINNKKETKKNRFITGVNYVEIRNVKVKSKNLNLGIIDKCNHAKKLVNIIKISKKYLI